MKRLAPAIFVALGLTAAHAQETPQNVAPAPEATPTAPPTAVAPSVPANVALPPPILVAPPPPANVEAPPPKPEAPTPAKPPPLPPGPVRSPTAVLRVLDKVTAETMRFEAPVGRRVRYKTLIFVVKACETRGLKEPMPRPSAYVVIDSEPLALPGRAPPPAKEIYRGWMFAAAPGLHPFEHPVYDAWLEGCTSDTLIR